ncbi:MAG: hypothetical protein IT186_12235 [Acidobacteria bacterium]|nr:hypothetical protein [Acidobacteriota bacterium]
MALDVSHFERLAVADTCAVWNVLSSRALHGHAIAAGCSLSLTVFGVYECLHKPRKTNTEAARELQRRLKNARAQGQFKSYALDLEDLQDVGLLEKRRNLSKGELAGIAFARKTRQAFLTDDQAARSLAATVMDTVMVQTTPHLVGWLVFIGRLGDGDIGGIVQEHENLARPLKTYFLEMYHEGMRCRLLASG